MIRALVTALILCLALPATAAADRWRPGDVERAIAVADAHWPTSACFGNHQITWASNGPVGEYGEGLVGGCAVTIFWDTIPVDGYRQQLRMLCTLLEHEFGHNAGREHSSNPRDPMYPYLVRNAPDCAVAFRSERRWGRNLTFEPGVARVAG